MQCDCNAMQCDSNAMRLYAMQCDCNAMRWEEGGKEGGKEVEGGREDGEEGWREGGRRMVVPSVDCTPIVFPPCSTCSKSLFFLPHPPSRLLLHLLRDGVDGEKGGRRGNEERGKSEGRGGRMEGLRGREGVEVEGFSFARGFLFF